VSVKSACTCAVLVKQRFDPSEWILSSF